MKRRVHSATDNLDWTIRLIWTPTAIRPIGTRQIYSGSVAPELGMAFSRCPSPCSCSSSSCFP
jgi:hypothetical protein